MFILQLDNYRKISHRSRHQTFNRLQPCSSSSYSRLSLGSNIWCVVQISSSWLFSSTNINKLEWHAFHLVWHESIKRILPYLVASLLDFTSSATGMMQKEAIICDGTRHAVTPEISLTLPTSPQTTISFLYVIRNRWPVVSRASSCFFGRDRPESKTWEEIARWQTEKRERDTIHLPCVSTPLSSGDKQTWIFYQANPQVSRWAHQQSGTFHPSISPLLTNYISSNARPPRNSPCGVFLHAFLYRSAFAKPHKFDIKILVF